VSLRDIADPKGQGSAPAGGATLKMGHYPKFLLHFALDIRTEKR